MWQNKYYQYYWREKFIMIMIPMPIIRKTIIIKRFLKAGAVDKNHAVQPSSIRVNQRLIFSHLVSKGKIVDTGNGKYFVDTTKI